MWGREAKNNRLFINAVFWILRTGAPWRDLPPDYGDWKKASSILGWSPKVGLSEGLKRSIDYYKRDGACYW